LFFFFGPKIIFNSLSQNQKQRLWIPSENHDGMTNKGNSAVLIFVHSSRFTVFTIAKQLLCDRCAMAMPPFHLFFPTVSPIVSPHLPHYRPMLYRHIL
jgi:hypothetical protein